MWNAETRQVSIFIRTSDIVKTGFTDHLGRTPGKSYPREKQQLSFQVTFKCNCYASPIFAALLVEKLC